MIDAHNNHEASNAASSPAAQPVIPLAYDTSGAHPLASAARGLGLVLVVLGTIHFFVLDPLSIFVALRQQVQYPQAQRRTILEFFAASVLISLAFNAIEIIVGIPAIHRRPIAVRGLLIWAWCAIGYVVIGSTLNIWFQSSVSGRRSPSSQMYVVFYVLE